ncbi:P22 phage major capsid protein family protein [Leptospira santarosai]|uniref:Coat protein, P22 domain protein n=1 Tax=Leptospira santarosai str. ZUN179 TaxID=1049985 RepID=M6URW1_9LEPT|nr:P22 phage major capsid protein family protein [Leptospira santarosai]EMO43794.1 coat protein, P22 domain protein [Leptospira santarosai str. ZUN179]MDO6383429.1 P22 phage major capsid protein family protein [Leptospira santarosai]
MANTGQDLLYPEFWFDGWDVLDTGILNFQNQVSRSIENKLAEMGDTVTIPITPDMGDAVDYNPKDDINATNVNQQVKKVTLTESKRQTITLDSAELSLSSYDLIEKYAAPMALSLYRTVNKFIYGLSLKSKHIVDGRSGVDKNTMIALRTLLSNNKVTGEKSLVCAPDDYGSLLSIPEFFKANESGDTSALRDGKITRALGFNVSENHAIETYTPQDLAGAVNKSGGYASGSSEIEVDAFADSLTPIRPGDVFTVAGETGSPIHTVIGTVKTSGITTKLIFDAPLRSAIADDAVITFISSRSMVAFVPSALAFGARAYRALPEGTGVRSVVAMLAGLPVRVSVWTHDLKVKVQYDILYGGDVINSNRIGRILV